MDRALSGATIPGQSGPGSNGNEAVLRIPQSSSITGTSPSDCLMSYTGHSLEWGGLTVSVFYSPSWLGNCFLRVFCTHLYGIKYSYLIQIICIKLYGFKYSYLIQIIYSPFHGFKLSLLFNNDNLLVHNPLPKKIILRFQVTINNPYRL